MTMKRIAVPQSGIYEAIIIGRRTIRNYQQVITKSHLKNWILVQSQGGAEFQPAGPLKYVEESKQRSNTEIGPIDIFRDSF
jgi:hypothetical protein